MADQPTSGGRRVRRGEGEVTQWPRGVVGYVSSGPEDAVPDPEEDRLKNRLELAARLIALLRAQGRSVDAETGQLRDARAALGRGDRADAAARVERLLAGLGQRADERGPGGPTRP